MVRGHPPRLAAGLNISMNDQTKALVLEQLKHILASSERIELAIEEVLGSLSRMEDDLAQFQVKAQKLEDAIPAELKPSVQLTSSPP